MMDVNQREMDIRELARLVCEECDYKFTPGSDCVSKDGYAYCSTARKFAEVAYDKIDEKTKGLAIVNARLRNESDAWQSKFNALFGLFTDVVRKNKKLRAIVESIAPHIKILSEQIGKFDEIIAEPDDPTTIICDTKEE